MSSGSAPAGAQASPREAEAPLGVANGASLRGEPLLRVSPRKVNGLRWRRGLRAAVCLVGSARRRERVDVATPDLSVLGLLPIELIERFLSFLPLPFLSNSVKNVNPRYRELALPLLVKRMIWLERELSHDVFELVTEFQYAQRRHFYVELEHICKTLDCATYIKRPPVALLLA